VPYVGPMARCAMLSTQVQRSSRREARGARGEAPALRSSDTLSDISGNHSGPALRGAMSVGSAIAYRPTAETSYLKGPEGLRGHRVIL
jgi:hypothetical protein